MEDKSQNLLTLKKYEPELWEIHFSCAEHNKRKNNRKNIFSRRFIKALYKLACKTHDYRKRNKIETVVTKEDVFLFNQKDKWWLNI